MNYYFIGILLCAVVNSTGLFAQSGPVNSKTIGVLLYTGYPGKGQPVYIYNKGGKLVRKLVVDDNLTSDEIISPFAMSGEYNLLVFDCIGQTQVDYIVVTNDSRKLIGYIRKKQKDIIFQTWEQHLQKNGATIDFDDELNPIHSKPDPKSTLIKSGKVDFYFKQKIHGDWMRIYWNTPKKGSGWIRWWSKRDKLLIGVYYIM